MTLNRDFHAAVKASWKTISELVFGSIKQFLHHDFRVSRYADSPNYAGPQHYRVKKIRITILGEHHGTVFQQSEYFLDQDLDQFRDALHTFPIKRVSLIFHLQERMSNYWIAFYYIVRAYLSLGQCLLRCLDCDVRVARAVAERRRTVERKRVEMEAVREMAAFWLSFIPGQQQTRYDVALQHEAQDGLANARNTGIAGSPVPSTLVFGSAFSRIDFARHTWFVRSIRLVLGLGFIYIVDKLS